MRKKILFLLAISVSLTAFSQKKLTLKEAVIGQWFQFRPDDKAMLQWSSLPNTYSFLSTENESKALMHQVVGEQPEVFLTLSDLQKVEGLEKLQRIPLLHYETKKSAWFKDGTQFYEVHLGSKSISPILSVPKEAENVAFNFVAQAAAYTKGNSLFVTDKKGEHVIAESHSNDTVFGKAVSRSEFGIHNGIFWSNNGTKLAFYRNDQSEVTDYPLVRIDTRPATAEMIKYPFAGGKSEHIHLGVYDLKSNTTSYLNTDDTPNQYLTNIAWGPKDAFVYIAVLNRDQNHMKLNRYAVESGALDKTLFEERSEKYVHPQHTAMFLEDKSEQFLWQSARDGYNHLYLYNTEGELIKQVTKGSWVVTDVMGCDSEGNLWVQGTTGSAVERALYKISKEDMAVSRVTKKEGVWSGSVHTHSAYVLARHSHIDVPNDIHLLNSTGKIEKTLVSSPDKLVDYELSKPELFTFTQDGHTVNGRLIKPSDFDPNKKYPLLLYVYNGPGVQLIQNRYLGAASLWMYYFAQQGFMVLTVDGRGSKNNGLAFEQATFRQLGKLEMEDQMAGLEYVISQGNVDEDRIVVHGWSYGGFMTTNLMLNHPNTFTRGIAGGPVMTWEMYEVMYTERYMDTPESNPEGYAQADLISKAGNLSDNLLVIHGSIDNVVLPQHSLEFLKECVSAGVQVDFFTYPMHEHNVRGMDRVHLIEKVFNYALEGVVY